MNSIAEILQTPISPLEKGMPPSAGVTVGSIGDRAWNALNEDMSFPIALLRDTALHQNAAWMERFAQDQGVWLYPHGKTTMAPQLFALQLHHGCKGITAANVIHAEVYLAYGVESVFIANQVVGRQSIRRLAALCEKYPNADFFLIVDSKANAIDLKAGLSDYMQRGQVKPLLEMGGVGGRTGVRSADEAVQLARDLSELGMPAHGIEAFEGIYNPDDVEASERAVRKLLEEICSAFNVASSRDYLVKSPRYLSAGGSWYYDLVAEYFNDCADDESVQTIIRAGCTISHDSGLCRRAYQNLLARKVIVPSDHLQPALEVWAQVQSQPQSGWAFANAGKRDLSYDMELPTAMYWLRPGLHDSPQPIDNAVTVTALNDQHAYLRYDERIALEVGDLIGFGISHPCTTFDKWKYLFTVADDYRVTGAIKTFF